MPVFAINGWKTSGKDFTSNILVNDFGFKRLAFADKLKDLVASTYNVPRDWFDDQNLKEQPLSQFPILPNDPVSDKLHHIFKDSTPYSYHTPRSLCILEGCVKRSVDPNFWIREVVNEIRAKPWMYYCISDVRFMSEIGFLMSTVHPLITMRIDRYDVSPSSDPSEHDLDNFKFDYIINNRLDREHVKKQLVEILSAKT